MVRYCCVKGCKSTPKKGARLFAVPLGKNVMSIRAKWLKVLGKPDNFVKKLDVCHLHFCENDVDIGYRFSAIKNIKLKRDAIPHLHIKETNAVCMSTGPTTETHPFNFPAYRSLDSLINPDRSADTSQDICASFSDNISIVNEVMPGRRCAVFGCNNSRIATKAKGENVIYHNFPKEAGLESETIRREWVRLCGRADKWNPNTSAICSAHFCEDDYKRDMQNELLGLPTRRILKKTAVPTMNLPKAESQSESSRKQRRQKRKKKEEAEEEEEEVIYLRVLSDSEPSISPAEDMDTSAGNLSVEHDYEVKYNELLMKHNKLKTDFLRLRQTTRRRVKALNDQVNYYKKKCAQLNKSGKEKATTNLLKRILSNNQITLLSNKKK